MTDIRLWICVHPKDGIMKQNHEESKSTETVGAYLDDAVSAFTSASIDSPRVTAEWLFAHIFNCRRAELAQRIRDPLPEKYHNIVRAAITRIASGEPLQYVIGNVDFMGHILHVDSRVLIPRPETEELVELVLRSDYAGKRSLRIVDVCTGSGCVAIALASAWPEAQVLGVDKSRDALAVACCNAEAIGVNDRIQFVQHDLLEGIENESVDIVVSNPPYVSTPDWKQLDPKVRCFEPRIALDGGEDGLMILFRLLPQALSVLVPGGGCFMEIGEDQGLLVSERMRMFGFQNVRICRDITGKDRFAVGCKKA